MKKLTFILLCLFALKAAAQVTTDPAILQQGQTGSVKIIFDPAKGNKGMLGADSCFMYSCVQVDNQMKDGKPDWKYELAPWPSYSSKTRMTKSGSKWVITIPNLNTFYGVAAGQTITKILVLFTDGVKDSRSGRGPGGQDIIIDVVGPGIHVAFAEELEALSSQGSRAVVKCHATETAELVLKQNGTEVKRLTGTDMEFNATFSAGGKNTFELTGTTASGSSTATTSTYVATSPVKQNRPSGILNGIYYNSDPSKVTLCTYAGSKTEAAKHVFVVGDFNNWEISNSFQLKQANDSSYFWIELQGLTPKKEYAFQYVVMRADGEVKRICDLYSEKVLTWDDRWEPSQIDPDLMPYPEQADGSFVTVIQTGKDAYKWSDATLNFKRPNKNNLVIYELWVYDHTPARTIAGIMERLDYLQNLGVNAIELMPITEFDGNENWGYSPCLYFALDKAYATPTQFKDFVDACHQRGMAVILDMVFNHATGNNPMNKLYPKTSETASLSDLRLNPWFNVTAPHPDNVYEDWNHDFGPAHTMFIRALNYWIKEYKVDGYRMDLSHGLCGPSYNAVTNLKDYYAKGVKAAASDAYFILEHWGNHMSSDRPELVNAGMMCWQNTNAAYMQTAMGWLKPDDEGHTDGFDDANKDNYVSYCNNHDEERPWFKAKQWGDGDMKTDLAVRCARIPLNMAFQVLLNGPQLFYHYDEIGFDFSKFQNADGEWGSDGHDKYGIEPYVNEEMKMKTKFRPEPWINSENPRMQAYQKVAQIIQLRTRLLPKVFEGDPTAASISGGKSLRTIQWGSNVFAAGNFAASGTQTVSLPSGTWYDYLGGATKAAASYTLQPGEVKVFTGAQLQAPEIPSHYDFKVGVENVFFNEAPKASKILRNGQVLILRGDQVYDLMGRRVK